MSLTWNELETHYEASHRMLPDSKTDLEEPLKTEVSTDD
jgi:hypothetical protein